MDTTIFLRKCKNPQIDADIDRALDQLSKHNYAFVKNGRVSQYLGNRLKVQKNQGLVIFTHNLQDKEHRFSVISIPHNYILERPEKRRLKWKLRF